MIDPASLTPEERTAIQNFEHRKAIAQHDMVVERDNLHRCLDHAVFKLRQITIMFETGEIDLNVKDLRAWINTRCTPPE